MLNVRAQLARWTVHTHAIDLTVAAIAAPKLTPGSTAEAARHTLLVDDADMRATGDHLRRFDMCDVARISLHAVVERHEQEHVGVRTSGPRRPRGDDVTGLPESVVAPTRDLVLSARAGERRARGDGECVVRERDVGQLVDTTLWEIEIDRALCKIGDWAQPFRTDLSESVVPVALDMTHGVARIGAHTNADVIVPRRDLQRLATESEISVLEIGETVDETVFGSRADVGAVGIDLHDPTKCARRDRRAQVDITARRRFGGRCRC
jgi:hypothetical protein